MKLETEMEQMLNEKEREILRTLVEEELQYVNRHEDEVVQVYRDGLAGIRAKLVNGFGE